MISSNTTCLKRNSICRWMKAMLSFIEFTITKKHSRKRLRLKLILSIVTIIRKTFAAKDTQITIFMQFVIQCFKQKTSSSILYQVDGLLTILLFQTLQPRISLAHQHETSWLNQILLYFDVYVQLAHSAQVLVNKKVDA